MVGFAKWLWNERLVGVQNVHFDVGGKKRHFCVGDSKFVSIQTSWSIQIEVFVIFEENTGKVVGDFSSIGKHFCPWCHCITFWAPESRFWSAWGALPKRNFVVSIGIAPSKVSISIFVENGSFDIGGISINFIGVGIVWSADFCPRKFWQIDIWKNEVNSGSSKHPKCPKSP